MKYFAIIMVGLVLGVAAVYAAAESDNKPAASCPPGSHFKVTEPNGSELVIRRDIRDLPKGAYIQAGQIKVYRDGRVTWHGEVTCITEGE